MPASLIAMTMSLSDSRTISSSCSQKHPVASQKVKREMEPILSKGCKQQRTVFFPFCLDKTVIMPKVSGPAVRIRNTHRFGGPTQWKTHEAYQKVFDHLSSILKEKQRSIEGEYGDYRFQ